MTRQPAHQAIDLPELMKKFSAPGAILEMATYEPVSRTIQLIIHKSRQFFFNLRAAHLFLSFFVKITFKIRPGPEEQGLHTLNTYLEYNSDLPIG